ncbi:MAG: hypothetical protein V2B18_25940, partial [Pseudomonadota bacterium]
HEVLAKRIAKDRTNITNYIRLLKLPDRIKEDLRNERLTMGHARTLLSVEHLPMQLKLAGQVVKRRLSVRDLEKIVQNYRKKSEKADAEPIQAKKADNGLSELEKSLSSHFSARVSVRSKDGASGRIEIHFHDREELDRLLEAFGYREDFS